MDVKKSIVAPFRLLYWYSSDGTGKNHLNQYYVYPATKSRFESREVSLARYYYDTPSVEWASPTF